MNCLTRMPSLSALCRNTEFEDTEESAESEFEEYELASDDHDQEQEHSDDNDSVIEVGVN